MIRIFVFVLVVSILVLRFYLICITLFPHLTYLKSNLSYILGQAACLVRNAPQTLENKQYERELKESLDSPCYMDELGMTNPIMMSNAVIERQPHMYHQ
jgi:hypothetical protein